MSKNVGRSYHAWLVGTEIGACEGERDVLETTTLNLKFMGRLAKTTLGMLRDVTESIIKSTRRDCRQRSIVK